MVWAEQYISPIGELRKWSRRWTILKGLRARMPFFIIKLLPDHGSPDLAG